jgi:hypothetical protein
MRQERVVGLATDFLAMAACFTGLSGRTLFAIFTYGDSKGSEYQVMAIMKRSKLSIYLLIVFAIVLMLGVLVQLILMRFAGPVPGEKFSDIDRQQIVNREARIQELLPKAEEGDVKAQTLLSRLYAQKRTTEGDKEAFDWIRKAAEGGDIEAQYLLAGRYACGEGVERRPEEAAKWYLLAAKKGDVVSQYALAQMYQNGVGVKKDPEMAAFWRSKVKTVMDSCPSCDLPSGLCVYE